MDFSDGAVELLKAQQERMEALYERLLSQKQEAPIAPKYPTGGEKRKDLPRIEYSKLVNLSLSNFDEYKTSVYNLGYSRQWPTKWSKPSFQDLKEEWDGEEGQDAVVRREAYLVLLNTIPQSLKYLVRQVRSGDVIGIWKAIHDRFLHVTTIQVKVMIDEWNNLSMAKAQVGIDRFVSLVVSKSQALREVGEEKDDAEEAATFLNGLSIQFDWLKNYVRMQDVKSNFMKLVKIAVDYAHDNKMLDNTKQKTSYDNTKQRALFAESGNDVPKGICRYYCTAKGCVKKFGVCPFRHIDDVNSKPKVGFKGNNKEKAKRKFKAKEEKALAVNEEKKKACFGCGSYDHLTHQCPKVNSFPKMLTAVDSVLANSRNKKIWIMDGGSSQHITSDFKDLHQARKLEDGEMSFIVGNNQLMTPTHVGRVHMGPVTLTNVYYCKECPAKLVSESRLVSKGCTITKTAITGECLVFLDEEVVIRAVMQDSLFCLVDWHNAKYSVARPVFLLPEGPSEDGKKKLERIKALVSSTQQSSVYPTIENPGIEEVKEVALVQQPYDAAILLDYQKKKLDSVFQSITVEEEEEIKPQPLEEELDENYSTENCGKEEDALPDLENALDDEELPDMFPHYQTRRNPSRTARGTLEESVNRSSIFVVGQDPQSRSQAINASDAELWVEAERKELEAKAKMGVCVLHPLPQDRLQDCCFVYQKNIEGFVYKRKFRKFALAQKNSQVKSGYDPPYQAECFKSATYSQGQRLSDCGKTIEDLSVTGLVPIAFYHKQV